MTTRNVTMTLTAVLFTCAAVVVGAIAGAEGKSGGKKRTHGAQAAQVDPGLAARYGVLRRGRVARDRLPRYVLDRMGPIAVPGSTPFRVDPEQSRRALAVDGRSIYVVPGAAKLCLEVAADEPTRDAGGEICSTAAQARTGYMISTVGMYEETGSERVEGLVPDGAKVSIAVAGGATLEAPVEGNVFSVELPQALRSVTVLERDGDSRTIDWSGN